MTRKYTTDIERLIFDLLFQKDKPVSYTQLFNTVKDARRKLSHETFNIHLNQLRGNGLLVMTTRCYFLTDKAYFLHQLEILEFNRPSQAFLNRTVSVEIEKRLKMHLLLSFYGHQRRFYHLQSRQLFEDFLSGHQLCENDLRVLIEDDIKYKNHTRHIKEFFPVRPGRASYSIEIRTLEEKSIDTIGKISYAYSVPGFNITDILKAVVKNLREFYYLDFTRSDLQEEIDMLLTEGMMERIGEFDNVIRYKFSDPFVLGKLWELYDDLFNMMAYLWKYLRGPKEEEKEWLEFFYGDVEGWLQDLRHNRSSNKRKNRKAIDHITESMPEIHKDFENLIDWHKNQKYTFFIDKLLEYIYPVFMRNPFSSAFEVRRSYAANK